MVALNSLEQVKVKYYGVKPIENAISESKDISIFGTDECPRDFIAILNAKKNYTIPDTLCRLPEPTKTILGIRNIKNR
jgi:hypothetical protein